MVQCDACQKWLHYECVGVDDSIRDKPWKCVPCGGSPYPALSGMSSQTTENPTKAKKNSNQPTVDELLALLEQQQEREARLQEDYEQMTNEYSAVKRMLESGRVSNVAVRKQETAEERFQRVLENESRLSMSSVGRVHANLVAMGPHSQDTPESLSSHYTPDANVRRESRFIEVPTQVTPPRSELSQLAVLMKQALIEDLPKFNGNARDWPLFLAVFRRTTTLASIDDVTNVGRLTKALEGEARELVLDQLTYGLSPKGIIETLEKRYGRRDVVLRTIASELMNFPVLSGMKDSRLQNFAVALKTYVAQLKSMGFLSDLSNNLLESLLLEKLVNTPSLYRKWMTKKMANESVNIESFANFVMHEWECLPPCFSSTESRESPSRTKPRSVNVHMATGNKKRAYCLNCGGAHALVECFKFKHLSVSDRWNVVKKARVCFSCLSSQEHRIIDCPGKKECSEPGCEKPHHRLLHNSRNESSSVTEHQGAQTRLSIHAGTFEPSQQSTSPPASITSHQTHAGISASVTAKVVAVRIYGADGIYVDDYAFLDDGSTVTMMEKSIADRLGLKGAKENLHLRWTKGITRVEECIRCDITVSGVNESSKFILNDVFCVSNLDLAPVSQSGTEMSSRYRHLRRLPLPNFQNVKPGILIGLDHATLLSGKHIVEGKLNEPLASRTKLGWIVYGRHDNFSAGASSTNVRKQGFQLCHTRLAKQQDDADRQLHEAVKGFFAVENVGVAAKQLKSAEVERAEQIMKSTMRMVEGRYEVGLLWKTDDEKLPENNGMALKRLISEERKLSKEPASLDWMNQHVQKLIDKSYAREATVEDLETGWKRKWICPLFTVVNRNKIPPKRRCVADVAASEKGAANLLKEEVRLAHRNLSKATARKMNLEWRFIPAYSPWIGGACERLIGYIKKCINFCLAGETPSESVLNNALVEAELLTNKRPLTHTPIDPDDDEPLTPNIALFGEVDAPQTLCPDDDSNKFARLSRKRVAHLVKKLQRCWERFNSNPQSTTKSLQRKAETNSSSLFSSRKNGCARG